jgi:P-type E1-E2 ATPase
VSLRVDIPGRELQLEFLLLDVNGTLSDRGALLEGVRARMEALADQLEVRLLSADTFGTLEEIERELPARAQTVISGEEKVALIRELGVQRCVAIGNGTNDTLMLREAALGIAVLGPEGASGAALSAADVVCGSIFEALDLLREPTVLVATLRP